MPVYLSRLMLNPRSHDVRRDLAGAGQLHRTVLAMFPELPDEARAAGIDDARMFFGVLHRLDADSRTGGLTLLVQSRIKPSFDGLPKDYLVGTGAESKLVDDTYAAIEAGMQLAFRLRAKIGRAHV